MKMVESCTADLLDLGYFQDSDDERDDDRREREKRERVEKSIREREKEVQESLSSSLRERDKEREQHKRDEAIQHFKALLADLVSLIAAIQETTNRSRLVFYNGIGNDQSDIHITTSCE